VLTDSFVLNQVTKKGDFEVNNPDITKGYIQSKAEKVGGIGEAR
jgi:hypothetical protein